MKSAKFVFFWGERHAGTSATTKKLWLGKTGAAATGSGCRALCLAGV